MPEERMPIAIGERCPIIVGIRVSWVLVLILRLRVFVRLGCLFWFFVLRSIQVIEHTLAWVGVGIGGERAGTRVLGEYKNAKDEEQRNEYASVASVHCAPRISLYERHYF